MGKMSDIAKEVYERLKVAKEKYTRTLNVSIEDIVSNMEFSKEQREELYLSMIKMDPKKCTVIWENDRIAGFRPIDSIESIKMTLEISPEGINILKENKDG